MARTGLTSDRPSAPEKKLLPNAILTTGGTSRPSRAGSAHRPRGPQRREADAAR